MIYEDLTAAATPDHTDRERVEISDFANCMSNGIEVLMFDGSGRKR